jgi:predicted GNAT family acetyltransferase
MRRRSYTIHPLTEDRWRDIENLFGPSGACMGCWCMYWRLPHAEMTRLKGAERKRLFRARVKRGPPPGLIAYEGAVPIGWVQAAPRTDTPGFNSAKRLSAPMDADTLDQRDWAISCFFVRAGHRGKGVTAALLNAAVAFAKRNGARTLEACPWDAAARKPTAMGLYVGSLSLFAAAGFKELVRRAPHRPLVRKTFRAR